MIYFGGGYPGFWYWAPSWLPEHVTPPSSDRVPLELPIPMQVVLAVERPVTLASGWSLAMKIVNRVRVTTTRGLALRSEIPARLTRQVRVERRS